MTDALRDFFASYYRLRPVNATFTGVHDYDDRLPDWSPDGLAAAVDEMRTLRASLVATRGQPPGSQLDQLRDVRARDRELAVAFLDIQIAELEGSHFQRRNPSLAVGEAAFAVISLMTRPFAGVTARATAAAARLAAMLLMRATDAMLSVPRLPLLMIVSAFLQPSVALLVILIGGTGWMETARVVRTEFRTLRTRGFVEGAFAAGAGHLRIIRDHLLPNAAQAVIVSMTLAVARGILLESALSFFAVGVRPPRASWGNMTVA